ncbi:E3 ubiquitin-protein ligase TRIM22-like [Cheilinus undulatus]|uniref:E3 ubiquitin-protein ligase TRIM22-like n=1 Tax=Cheilinus undulatus TaxID=241271 RepID=UPI001BD4E2B5|nr:E3 ubiquitin-protein ligase TRIM22-like [Cheilinus undulatus]
MSNQGDKKEDKAESPMSSAFSMKSDRSKGFPPDFSNEPGPGTSPFSSSLSMKSDRSKGFPPDFSNEPGPSDFQIIKRSVPLEEQLSSCALCQDVLRDPVSTSCGHRFCKQCISSYWDQSASSGESSCPQFGERPRPQISSQSRTVKGEVRRPYRVMKMPPL